MGAASALGRDASILSPLSQAFGADETQQSSQGRRSLSHPWEWSTLGRALRPHGSDVPSKRGGYGAPAACRSAARGLALELLPQGVEEAAHALNSPGW
jgi:hypothetical protein